jgi:hypothetical protein
MEMQTAFRETHIRIHHTHRGGMIQIISHRNLHPLVVPKFPGKSRGPPYLIVNLTKEEWTEVQIYGLKYKKDDRWEFSTDPDRLPYEGVNLYLDVALCLQELHRDTLAQDVYVLPPHPQNE